MALKNFVNYETVKVGENPVEQMVMSVESEAINPEQKPIVIRYSLVETRVSLQDSLLQLMTEPEKFSMLNLNRLDRLKVPFPTSPDSFKEFWFDLSVEVKIEKRVVNSLPSLFGEVGGLNDLLATLVLLLIGMFQANAFIFDLATTFFKIGKDT